MILSELKSGFFAALQTQYPQEEIQSFFSILALHYLKLTRLEVTLQADKELIGDEQLKILEAIERLKHQEPIQYIIGETEFYGLVFKVNQHTLIPRPETEELVEWILNDHKDTPLTLLDIGTGSGCIVVALAHHLSAIDVTAVDISSEALKIASENASAHNVKVDFLHQNILTTTSFPKQFDVIVSNPPYVREQEKEKMQENVLVYEPSKALFVTDEDPLRFYRKISELAITCLKPDGFLYFEINEYLSVEMEHMLHALGFKDVEVKLDIFGKHRMIKAYNHA